MVVLRKSSSPPCSESGRTRIWIGEFSLIRSLLSNDLDPIFQSKHLVDFRGIFVK